MRSAFRYSFDFAIPAFIATVFVLPVNPINIVAAYQNHIIIAISIPQPKPMRPPQDQSSQKNKPSARLRLGV
jgi:hypothetical protein